MATIVTPAVLSRLFTVYKGDFQTAYAAAQAEAFWKDVATEISSGSSSNSYGWLGDFPDMIEWVGARTVKSMKSTGYEIFNKEFEATVSVPKPQIADDNSGIYRPMMQAMGNAAARHPDQLIAGLIKSGDASLCYDGQNFFDTDHPVNEAHDGSGADASVSNMIAGAGPKWWLLDTTRPLKPFIHQVRERPNFVAKQNPQTSDDVFTYNRFTYGVDSRCNVGYGFWQQAVQIQAPLDGDALDAGIKMMQEFKGDGGRPLGLSPNLLVAPPALRSDANKAVKVMLGEGGASNANYQAVDVKIVPWLA